MNWSAVRHFTPEEWPRWEETAEQVIYGLDVLRSIVGVPIHVHVSAADASARQHAQDSQHYRRPATAVDFHAEGISLAELWLAAETMPEWRGVGVYPWWVTPGLHLDIRESSLRVRWMRDPGGIYRPFYRSELAMLATYPLLAQTHIDA